MEYYEIYKLKIEGQKDYLEATYIDPVTAIEAACVLFESKEKPITVYRKRKYHKKHLVITAKNQYVTKIRTGVIKAMGETKLDFFEMLMGNNNQGATDERSVATK